MKLRTIAASVTLSILPVNHMTCIKDPPVTTPPQKVSLEEEPVQALKPLKQNTGALESGKWETIYQQEGVSLYKVQYKGKNITVIGDWHTKPGKIALSQVLKEVKINPRTWKLLIEGLDYIPEITREIKDNVGKAVSLPHAGEGIKFLIDSKQVTAQDMALAYAMARLDRISRELNTTQEERDNPLEQVSIEISNNLKALHEIILGKEEIKKMILASTSSKEKLAEAVKKSNEIILHKVVEVSDRMIALTVTEELKGPEQNILIHMGEGHLRSLINSGPIAEYTAKLLEKVKTDPAFVQKALDASKVKTEFQEP